MTKVISMNERGTLTLPKEFRQKFGLKAGGQIVIEETDEGILLRAGFTSPVEMYSSTRLAEFERNNEEALAGFNLKR